ncbi:cytochrome and DOMON domain-containing protein [Aspergillus clavatus NRRL 1]|uniref:Cellobiose dehydrogenase n=1 Tax=Aspergillus clavatus (strain ATCC 1007 / CBS 513.65 / DSM 816 / NCTC 3887 / NRRL 1 / QM 1276 / 107) TaxID=344612 RepID=A1C4G2_ASPCL|nr:uncharacterized protein ACLA_059690 [Aspergillus clavatus NRRL 1]EAW15302.1 conserved hypothetical protein [Aspergillus clavatus NRRL 1]
MTFRIHTWARLAIALSLFTGCEANPALFHPQGRDDISFTVAVSNATNSSGTDALFLQIQAPSTVQWVALGQGDQMAGARIFLVYASSRTNVTVSPRTGTGHVPPEFDPEIPISLLSGTGINDGVLTARFECQNCLDGHGGTANSTDAISRWIWAYKNGSPIESDDTLATIDFHDSFGGAVVDLSCAQSTFDRDRDPFSNASSDCAHSIDELASSENYSLSTMAIAHGCLMSVAFVLLFPIFALLVPLSAVMPMPVMVVHAPLQGLALAIAIAGFGLGLKLWSDGGSPPAAHPVIGTVAVASLALIQPSLGLLQHKHFKRTGQKSWFAYVHRWFGRGMIALGIINGGIGLWWLGFSTGPLRTGTIVYGVVAGIVSVIYAGVHIYIGIGGAEQFEDAHGVEHQDGLPAEMRQSATTNGGAQLPDDIPRTGEYLIGEPTEQSFKL